MSFDTILCLIFQLINEFLVDNVLILIQIIKISLWIITSRKKKAQFQYRTLLLRRRRLTEAKQRTLKKYPPSFKQ